MAVVSRTDGKPWNREPATDSGEHRPRGPDETPGVVLDPDRVADAEARCQLMLVEAGQLRREAIQLEERAKQLAQTWGLDTHVP